MKKRVRYIYVAREDGINPWYYLWRTRPTWNGCEWDVENENDIGYFCSKLFHQFAFSLRPQTVVKVKVTRLKKGFKWEKC